MRSILLQFVGTAVLVGLLTYFTLDTRLRSPWNVAWLFGVPVVVAIFRNRDFFSRWLMSLSLIVWAWIVCGFTGTLLGGGP